MNFEEIVFRKLGQYDEFYTRPPLDSRKLYLKDGYLVSFNNDGHETWIGSMDKWYWHTKNKEFLKIALWFIGIWIFIDWFGLRSWLWFKLLHRKVNRARGRI